MRRQTGTTAQEAWVDQSRDASAKSLAFDGAYWTVRHYNDKSATPICTNPTPETKALLTFIRDFDAGQMVGAQVKLTDLALGPGQVQAVGGDYPAIYGYDILDLRPAFGSQLLNGPNAAAVKAEIEAKFSEGKIISIVDHMPNFLTGGDWYDRNNRCMREIGPGGSKHADFTAYLDRVISFIDSLNYAGKKVPVLLRTFHEVKLSAFWWSNYWLDGGATGEPWVTDADYIAAARFAIGYMKARLTNVIFMYCQGAANGPGANPDGTTFTPKDDDWYWSSYPGADYCDLITCDIYSNGAAPYPGTMENWPMRDGYSAASRLAQREGKPFAMAECGFSYSAQLWSTSAGSTPDEQAAGSNEFWTEIFLPQLRAKAIQPKFFLFWHGETTMATGNTQTANAAAMLQDKLIQTASDVSFSEIYG